MHTVFLIQLSLPLPISLTGSEVGTQSTREKDTGKEIFLKLILNSDRHFHTGLGEMWFLRSMTGERGAQRVYILRLYMACILYIGAKQSAVPLAMWLSSDLRAYTATHSGRALSINQIILLVYSPSAKTRLIYF